MMKGGKALRAPANNGNNTGGKFKDKGRSRAQVVGEEFPVCVDSVDLIPRHDDSSGLGYSLKLRGWRSTVDGQLSTYFVGELTGFNDNDFPLLRQGACITVAAMEGERYEFLRVEEDPGLRFTVGAFVLVHDIDMQHALFNVNVNTSAGQAVLYVAESVCKTFQSVEASRKYCECFLVPLLLQLSDSEFEALRKWVTGTPNIPELRDTFYLCRKDWWLTKKNIKRFRGNEVLSYHVNAAEERRESSPATNIRVSLGDLFGGQKKDNELLINTALRELRKESGGRFDLQPSDLGKCTSIPAFDGSDKRINFLVYSLERNLDDEKLWAPWEDVQSEVRGIVAVRMQGHVTGTAGTRQTFAKFSDPQSTLGVDLSVRAVRSMKYLSSH